MFKQSIEIKINIIAKTTNKNIYFRNILNVSLIFFIIEIYPV